MAKIPIGVQLYSVRDDCKTDLPGTLAAVAKMGYAAVEFAGYYDRTAQQLRKMLDDNGLKCCGTHTGMNTLLGDELKKTIDFHLTLGNKYLIVPWMPEERRNSRAACEQTAKDFAEIGEKVKPHGMKVGYHTHDCDVKPIDGGTSAWEILGDLTGPQFVLQLDTANSMHGGADPVALLKKYPGRAGTVHLKELSKSNPGVPVGEGDVKWKDVFAVCESTAGTEWYIVEHEKYGAPPLQCIDNCLKNLKKMGK